MHGYESETLFFRLCLASSCCFRKEREVRHTSTMKGSRFFLNPTGDRRAYCSCCGKNILQDRYNMKQHAKQCGFTEQDILEILTEEFCGYTLVKEDEKTLLLQAGQTSARAHF